MEFLAQLLFEVYLNIGEILVPEKKFKKWQETLLKVLCILACCTIIALIGVGIAVLVEGAERLRTTGIVFVAVGGALLVAQVILAVIVIVRDVKKFRAEKAEAKNMNFEI